MLKTDQGLLIRSLQSSDGGIYQCTSTEKNFKHTLVKLQLVVLSSRTVNNILVETGSPALPQLQSSAWTPSASQYKDLLTILSQPEMGLINQYCQDYWQLGDSSFGNNKGKSLKELKEQKKPRNRRHHEEQTTPAETWEAWCTSYSNNPLSTFTHNLLNIATLHLGEWLQSDRKIKFSSKTRQKLQKHNATASNNFYVTVGGRGKYTIFIVGCKK